MAAIFIIVPRAAAARASLYLVYFAIITINADVIGASMVPSVQLSLVDYVPPWVPFPMAQPTVAATVSCPHLHRN